MSSFRFGLQKVLDLREREQQERARLLAEAQRRAREAEARLELVQRIRGEEAEKLLRTHVRGHTVGHLRNLNVVISQMTEQVHHAEKALQDAAEKVEESRSVLVTSMRERRILDLLRARQRESWRLGQVGAERKEMDEVALGIFTRKAASDDGRES